MSKIGGWWRRFWRGADKTVDLQVGRIAVEMRTTDGATYKLEVVGRVHPVDDFDVYAGIEHPRFDTAEEQLAILRNRWGETGTIVMDTEDGGKLLVPLARIKEIRTTPQSKTIRVDRRDGVWIVP